MAPQLDDKLRSLIDPLRALGFVLKGIPNGFRIKYEDGPDVDIYTLRFNPSHIRARIRTQVRDEAARDKMIKMIQRQIADSLDNVADLQSFRLTKDSDGVFVYYAHLDISERKGTTHDAGSGETAEESTPSLEVTELMVEKAFADDEPTDVEPAEEALADAIDPSADEKAPAPAEVEIDFTAFMEEDEGPPSPETAVEQLEAVDAKTLRQAMDTLCLPRSSN